VSVFILFAGLAVLWLLKQVVGMLVAQQAKGQIPDYTARKARDAALLLPAEIAADYERDWLAELGALDGKPLSAICYAHGLPRAARSIAVTLGAEAAGSRWWPTLSRALDINGAILMLIVVAPLFSAFALALKCAQPGPVFALHPRLGRGARRFDLICFQTEVLRRHPAGELSHLLDRSGLAMMPNLINVLRGDISILGPPAQRPGSDPPAPLAVRPGMSSWQRLVEVRAVGISFQEARRRDRQRTFGNDMALMGQTLKLGLRQLLWPS
jgi:lipopolysaccharide/colanic/teichoic acid biosynthesis glycosyltransferase